MFHEREALGTRPILFDKTGWLHFLVPHSAQQWWSGAGQE